jgi:hypothetical protein
MGRGDAFCRRPAVSVLVHAFIFVKNGVHSFLALTRRTCLESNHGGMRPAHEPLMSLCIHPAERVHGGGSEVVDYGAALKSSPVMWPGGQDRWGVTTFLAYLCQSMLACMAPGTRMEGMAEPYFKLCRDHAQAQATGRDVVRSVCI